MKSMKETLKHIGCSLTDAEYKRLTEIVNANGTYISAALHQAILKWMENHAK